MKKVLILTWSYGSWHNAAANNLKKEILNIGHTCDLLDIVDFFNKNALNLWDKTKYFYEDFCEKNKKIWEITFNIFDNAKIKKLLYAFRYPFLQETFDKYLKENNYDVVISIFPFWQLFLKHYVKHNKKNFKIWVFITDSINIHSVWYLPNDCIDKYFFIDEESKKEFIKKFNHKKDNLVVSFFPLNNQLFYYKNEIKVKNILFLLTSQEDDFSFKLLKKYLNTDYNLLVVPWRNLSLYSKLKNDFKKEKNIIFYDRYDIKENIKNIDLIISKPGWAIIAESISNDIPFVITNYIPWQEEWNKKMIEKYELWFYERNVEKIFFKIKYIDFSRMIWNFKAVKKPNSIKIILENLDLL